MLESARVRKIRQEMERVRDDRARARLLRMGRNTSFILIPVVLCITFTLAIGAVLDVGDAVGLTLLSTFVLAGLGLLQSVVLEDSYKSDMRYRHKIEDLQAEYMERLQKDLEEMI